MRTRRLKVVGPGSDAVYHCMSRTVNGERFFGDLEKEVLRKMLWRVADFSGVEVLTYALMANHFHVLVRVRDAGSVTDAELMRRYRVLYPRPTRYQAASVSVMEGELKAGGEAAEAIRARLLARMGDVSAFMKTLKQRFSVWYNHSRGRFGPLWADRFKSVLVEGRGNPLQTMAAYIDLNPVRAGLVKDPKDYRFCGYAEAVALSARSARSAGSGQAGSGQAGSGRAVMGLRFVWAAYADGVEREGLSGGEALRMHRSYLFAKGAERGSEADRAALLKTLEQEDGVLPRAAALRCRVRYFTDGAILGSAEFVRGFVGAWQLRKERKRPPKVNPMRGADWGDLAVIRGLRRRVFE